MVIKYKKEPTQRQLKIGGEIRIAIAEVFSKNKLSHPFFEKHMFTVSEVKVSPDISVATVFMILPDELDQKQLLKFFNEIAKTIRKEIAPTINLKYMPDIRFVADDSVKHAAKISSLLKSVVKDEDK